MNLVQNLLKQNDSWSDILKFNVNKKNHQQAIQTDNQSTPILLRSNEYFSVYYDQRLKKQPGIDYKMLIIKFTGLANPELKLLQVYRLLNPFDVTLFDQAESKQTHKSSKQKQKVHIPDHNDKIKSSENTQTKKQKEKCKLSLQFLYFVRKCYNSYWRQNKSQISSQEIISKFNEILFRDVKTLQKFASEQVNQIFNIIKIEQRAHQINQEKRNTQLEEFLLYKLYKAYKIQSKFTYGYYEKIEKFDLNTFNKLREYDKLINPLIVDSHSIQIIIHKYFKVYEVINSKEQKQQILNQHYFTLEKRIIQFMLQNLQNYQYQTNSRKQQIYVKDLCIKLQTQQSKIEGKDAHINLPNQNLSFFTTNQQFLKYELISNENGLTNSKSVNNEIIFLYQLKQPNKCFHNSPKKFFNQSLSIIVEYYKLFDLLTDPQTRLKKSLLPISVNTLIWNPFTQELELDKLEVWKLLFGLENNPLSMDMYIIFMNKLELNKRDEVLTIIKDIYHEEIQLRSSERSMKSQQKLIPISLAPIINLIMVAFKIFHNSESQQVLNFNTYLKQTKYQKAVFKKNIKQLFHRLYDKIKNPHTIHSNQDEQNTQNNHVLHDYVDKLGWILTNARFKNFTDELIRQQQRAMNQFIKLSESLSSPSIN